MKDTFSFVMPAELSKSEDGEWKVAGLASTQTIDQQGETIIQKGIDLTPIAQNRGYFNFDHLPGPENLIGTVDGYKQTGQGLYVHGKLFKNHDKAKAVYQIMSSLNKGENGRVGLSVEGKILKRDDLDPKIITKCQIDKVAITFNPVNQQTYADLVKSMSSTAEIEFNSVEDNFDKPENIITFTADQVVEIVQKALGVGAGYMQAPNTLSNGDAMATSDLKKPKKESKEKEDDSSEDKSQEKPKKMKKLNKDMYKSYMKRMLEDLQELYPECSRAILWEAIKDRMNSTFPNINDEYTEI